MTRDLRADDFFAIHVGDREFSLLGGMKSSNKKSLRARRRLLHDTARETEALLQQPDYLHLERWQKPDVEIGKHEISVDIRETWPNGRASCTCGWETGWIPLWDAEQRAAWHRLDSIRPPGLIPEQGDNTMFDRSQFASFAPLLRRPDPSPVPSPLVPLPVLGDHRPIMLVFDHRDLAIELGYERQPHPDGTRVRSTSRNTRLYWVPPQTPVLAIGDGAIVYAQRDHEGYSVTIDHGNGWLSVYHRLEHMFVLPTERRQRRGVEVLRGDVLGCLAASSTAPLLPLRFELYRREHDDFHPIDPLHSLRWWRTVTWDLPPELRQPPTEPDQQREHGNAASGDRTGDPGPVETPRPAEAGEQAGEAEQHP